MRLREWKYGNAVMGNKWKSALRNRTSHAKYGIIRLLSRTQFHGVISSPPGVGLGTGLALFLGPVTSQSHMQGIRPVRGPVAEGQHLTSNTCSLRLFFLVCWLTVVMGFQSWSL
jgi:hypothetical protein